MAMCDKRGVQNKKKKDRKKKENEKFWDEF